MGDTPVVNGNTHAAEQYAGFFSTMVYRILCAQNVAPSLAICEGLRSHAETVAAALISTAVGGLVRSLSEVALEVRRDRDPAKPCVSAFVSNFSRFQAELECSLRTADFSTGMSPALKYPFGLEFAEHWHLPLPAVLPG